MPHCLRSLSSPYKCPTLLKRLGTRYGAGIMWIRIVGLMIVYFLIESQRAKHFSTQSYQCVLSVYAYILGKY